MSITLQHLIEFVGNEHISLNEDQDMEHRNLNEFLKSQLDIESYATYDHITLI